MDFEEHYLFSGHNKCRYYTRDSRSRSNKTQRKPEVYKTLLQTLRLDVSRLVNWYAQPTLSSQAT